MTAGTTFLVERYIAALRPADVDLLARRLAAATAELRAEGRDVHWLRSYALPSDETCLCIFSAATRADVEEANRRADAGYERIIAAIEVVGLSTTHDRAGERARPIVQSDRTATHEKARCHLHP